MQSGQFSWTGGGSLASHCTQAAAREVGQEDEQNEPAYPPRYLPHTWPPFSPSLPSGLDRDPSVRLRDPLTVSARIRTGDRLPANRRFRSAWERRTVCERMRCPAAPQTPPALPPADTDCDDRGPILLRNALAGTLPLRTAPPPRTPPSCGRPTRTRRTVRPAVLCGVLCRRAGVVEVVAGHDDERRHIDLLEVRPLLHLRGCRQMGSPASAARRGDPWTSAQRIRTPAPVAIPRPGQPWGRGQEPGAPGPIPAPGAAPRTAGKRVPPPTRPRPRPGRCPERPAGRHGPPGRDGCILGQGSAEVAEPRGGDDAEILPMRSMLGGVPGRSRPWRRGPIARDPPIPLRRTRSTRRRSRRYGCLPPGAPEPAGSPLALRGVDAARHRGSDAEPRREPAVKSFPYHLHHPDRPTGSSMANRDYPCRSISTPSHRTLPVPLPAGTNPSTPRS